MWTLEISEDGGYTTDEEGCSILVACSFAHAPIKALAHMRFISTRIRCQQVPFSRSYEKDKLEKLLIISGYLPSADSDVGSLGP